MVGIIKSELIKNRRTYGKRNIIIIPLVITILSIVLMGGRYNQIGAYNWWYVIFLPFCLLMLSMSTIEIEKKHNYFNLYSLSLEKYKLWMAKIFIITFYILVANIFVFGFTTISGLFLGSEYTIIQGLTATLVLTLTVAWQIPVMLFVSVRYHSFVGFIFMFVMNIICSGQPIAGTNLWLIPFAIPSRLMAPILRINPNGISLAMDSPLQNSGVISIGLIITIGLFVIFSAATSVWFERREIR